MIAAVADLEDGRGNRAHAAGGGVAGLRALDGCDLMPEHVNGGIKMPAIEVASPRFRAAAPVEDFGHGLSVHDGKGRAGLDGHVDAAVLAELVAHGCE